MVRSARRGIPLLVIVLLSLLLGPSPVWGGEPDASTREQDARTLFDRAVSSLRQGQFAEARDLLSQSLVLAERPATAFNLGVAYRGTGESLRAIETLQALLAGRYGKLDADQKSDVEALLRAVEIEVSSIEVSARGAAKVEVRIDGRKVGDLSDGESRVFRVDGGERLVSAFAPDYVPYERRVHVERGKRLRVAFALTPTREARVGHLVVMAPNPTDTLEIQGYPAARGRIERDVPPGRYRVKLTGEDGTREVTLNVRARSIMRHQFGAPRSRTTIWQSPVFWASAAGAVAAVTVGVLLLVGPPHEEPVSDPEFGVTEALRRR